MSTADRFDREGRFPDAERSLQSALEQARRLEPDLAPAALTYESLGSLYRDMRQCGESAAAYQRSLHLWEKVGPPGDRRFLQTANNLVSLYLECGNLEQAERHQRALVEPRARMLSREDPMYANVLDIRGSIQLAKHHNSEASALYQEALLLREHAASKSLPEMAGLLNNLAVSRARCGNAGQAIEYNRRALGLLESAGEPFFPMLVTLTNGAHLLRVSRRYTEAEPLIQRALALARSAYGEDSPTTAAVLLEYSAVLKGGKRKLEAAAMDRRAHQIQINSFRAGTRQTVDIRELSKLK
jgi:tetratricopeptide (TPR) repeat protein